MQYNHNNYFFILNRWRKSFGGISIIFDKIVGVEHVMTLRFSALASISLSHTLNLHVGKRCFHPLVIVEER
jgi:hypothetical protein